MNNKNVKTLYCYNKEKEVIYFENTNKGEEYYCIDCGEELICRDGQIYQKHLAHKNVEHCGNTGESILQQCNSTVSEITDEHLQRIEECDPNIIEGMNDNQKLASTHMEGACVVSAPAGAGKSKVLLGRIQYLISQGIHPSQILAFTFTKKASEEMKDRLNKLIGVQASQVTIGTFHSVYYSILRDYQNRIGGRRLTIAPDWWKEKTMDDLIKKTPSKFSVETKQALSFISKQKNNLRFPNDDLIIHKDSEFMLTIYRELYRGYEKIKDREGKIDFEDMILKCYDIFQKDNDFLQHYRNKFKYILVDEFQDSNTMQEKMLEVIVNDDSNLFVVGDVRQSIYGFLDANVNLMLDFQEKWNARLIELDINYRCSKEIVEYSNKLISHSARSLGGDVKANKPSNRKPILFESFNEYAEGKTIVNEIQDILKQGKYKPDDITILYRINAQSLSLEEELMKADLPYVIIGGTGFYDRREIKDMLSYLQLAKNPHNDKAMQEVFNRPNRFLGKVFWQDITDYGESNRLSIFDSMQKAHFCKEWRYQNGTSELVRVIKTLHQMYKKGKTSEEIISETMRLINYKSFLLKTDEEEQLRDRMENIATLVKFSGSQEFDTVDKFLDHIDNIKSPSNEEDTEGKIKLMTTHRSKGLEFPIVFIAGVSHYQFPFYREQYAHDFNIEEERRLMYVAMTRAEDELYISSIKSYGGQFVDKSQFIKEMTKRV